MGESGAIGGFISWSGRTGAGRALYEALLPTLRERGFRVAVAGMTLPNDASVGLHRAMGFEPVGTYRRIGFKLGAWHDVGWWQLRLLDLVPSPPPPLTLPEAQALPAWGAAYDAAITGL